MTVIIPDDNGEVEAVQAAASLAAAEAAGAASVKADQAQAEASEAQAKGDAALQTSAAAAQTAAQTAANQLTPEDVKAAVDSGLGQLAELLRERLAPPTPTSDPVVVAETKPPDAAPSSVKKDKRKSFADRWYGR